MIEWREVQPILSNLRRRPARVYGRIRRGGLFIAIGLNIIKQLGWQDGDTVTLLLGADQSAGKIALRKSGDGIIRISLLSGGKGKGSARVRVGRFDGLTTEVRTSEEIRYEISGGALALTMPRTWLVNAGVLAIAGRTIGIARSN